MTSDRTSLGVIFAVHGAAFGSWAARVPWVADHVSATPGQLGLALLMPGLGMIVFEPVASVLSRPGSGRAMVGVSAVCLALALAAPAVAPNLPTLCGALLLFGGSAGVADLAVNAQAARTEERAGRAIMSSFHGFWSIGDLLGSGVGVAAAHFGIDARVHLAGISLLLLVIAAAAASRVDPNSDRQVDRRAHRHPGEAQFVLPPRRVLLIGVVAFCGVFGEVASADWSAVYVRDVTGTGAGIAACAYAVFAAMMAIGRLAGDNAVRRFGPVTSVRVGGVSATAGALFVAMAGFVEPPSTFFAMAGFGLLGVGIAVVAPLSFSAAGRYPRPDQAIAGVATISYSAALAAPGLVGGIASVTSLPAAFLIVAALLVVVVFAAPAVRTSPS